MFKRLDISVIVVQQEGALSSGASSIFFKMANVLMGWLVLNGGPNSALQPPEHFEIFTQLHKHLACFDLLFFNV